MERTGIFGIRRKLLLFVDNVNATIASDSGLERLKHIPGAIILSSRRTSFSKEFEPYRIGFLSTEQCRKIYEKIRFEGSGKRMDEEDMPILDYIIDNLAARHTITVEFLAHLALTKRWTVQRLRDELEKNGFRLEYMDEEEKLVNIQKSYETLYDLSALTEAEQNILEAFSVFPYIPLSAEICNQWLLGDAGASEDDDILTGLYRKGWLQFDMEQESYTLHPVFAQFIYDKCRPIVERHLALIEACQKSLSMVDNGAVLECQFYILFAENILKRIYLWGGIEISLFMSTLANLLIHIAEYDKAEKMYESAIELMDTLWGELSVAVFDGHNNLGRVYFQKGQYKIQNNLADIYVYQGEYEKAEEMYKENLRIHEIILGENHPNTAASYSCLAGVYRELQEYTKAEELYEKSMKIRLRVLGENHPDTANSYNYLAGVYVRQGNYQKAKQLYKKCVKIRETALGEEHPDTAEVYNNLAFVYEGQGECSKAEELYKKSLRINERVLGEEHPDTVTIYNNLAFVYEEQGEYRKAEELYEKSLRIRERVLGEEHPDTATGYNNLAGVYERQGEYRKAEELYKKSLGIRERVLGEEHPDTAASYNNLAFVYESQGEHGKAEGLYEKSLRIIERVQGEEHPETAKSYNNLAGVYESQGEYRKAEELYKKSLRIIERVLGEEHPETATGYNNLAFVYARQGEYKAALTYYLNAYKVLVFKLGKKHPNTQIVYENMKTAFSEWNTEGDFEQWLEENMEKE